MGYDIREMIPGEQRDGRPIITFVSCTFNFDIDGREYILVVPEGAQSAMIKEKASGIIKWVGEAPDGPFGMDAGLFLAEKILP